MTTCSRSGCTKKLRASNSKGVCSSGCQSDEAPAYMRDVRAKPASKQVAKVEVTPETGSAVARFRAVHDAMGMDAAKTLEEFYVSWLDGIRQALES